jgi:hypothetical protein
MGLRMSAAARDLAIVKLDAGRAVPAWALAGGFFSVTRTPDELSVVAEQARIPSGVAADRGWCALKIEGPLPLSAVGILHSISGPLAGAGISIFAVSTHDTDYLLVKTEAIGRAVQALSEAGHTVAGPA